MSTAQEESIRLLEAQAEKLEKEAAEYRALLAKAVWARARALVDADRAAGNPWCRACGGVHPGIECPRMAQGIFQGKRIGDIRDQMADGAKLYADSAQLGYRRDA